MSELPVLDPDFPSIRLLYDWTSFGRLFKDPVLHQLQGLEGYGETENPILRWGQLYHGALEVRDTVLAKGGSEDLALDRATKYAGREGVGEKWEIWRDKYRKQESLLRYVRAYCKHYSSEGVGEDYSVFVWENGQPAVEQDFAFPIYLPNGEQLLSPSGRPYILCGYFDGLRLNSAGRLVGWERKHTASTLHSYVNKFEDDGQLLTYALALQILFPDLNIRSIVLDAAQLFVEKDPLFLRREFIFSKDQIEGHLQDLIMWIKLAEVMAVGEKANLQGLDPCFPRRRQEWGLFGKWKGICAAPPALRSNYAAAEYEKGELWNPTVSRQDHTKIEIGEKE